MIISRIIVGVLIVPLALMSVIDVLLAALDEYVVPLVGYIDVFGSYVGYLIGILGPKPAAVIALSVRAVAGVLTVGLSLALVVAVVRLTYAWLVSPLISALRGRFAAS